MTPIETLQGMMGLSYRFKGEEYKFLSMKQENTQVVIATDKKWLTKELSELRFFIESLEPVSVAMETLPNVQVHFFNKDMSTLSEIALENINKIKQNKEYLEQAKEVSNALKILVDAKKTELEIIRLQIQLSPKK